MQEVVIALLLIVNGEIKGHRIQDSMSECLKVRGLLREVITKYRISMYKVKCSNRNLYG